MYTLENNSGQLVYRVDGVEDKSLANRVKGCHNYEHFAANVICKMKPGSPKCVFSIIPFMKADFIKLENLAYAL